MKKSQEPRIKRQKSDRFLDKKICQLNIKIFNYGTRTIKTTVGYFTYEIR